MKQKVKRKVSAGKLKRRTQPYPYKFREKRVRLYLEEGYSTTVLREQFGVSGHSVIRWKRRLSMGQSAVNKPGPKKVEPLDLGQGAPLGKSSK